MTPLVQIVTTLLSVATILAEIVVAAVAVALIFRRGSALVRLAAVHALWFGLVVGLASFLLSLFYSSVAGFEPCTFCWWQRIFMYPQVVIFAVALYYRKNRDTVRALVVASLILSVIGGALALFQYYAQMLNPGLLSACAATGVSCTKLYFISFGHITLPFMSLVSFAFLIVVALAYLMRPQTPDA